MVKVSVDGEDGDTLLLLLLAIILLLPNVVDRPASVVDCGTGITVTTLCLIRLLSSEKSFDVIDRMLLDERGLGRPNAVAASNVERVR